MGYRDGGVSVEFRYQGLVWRFKVQGLGFRVEGLGCKV